MGDGGLFRHYAEHTAKHARSDDSGFGAAGSLPTLLRRWHPFAVGQLVNHPPQGIEANVQILEISEPLDETWAVSRLHQGLWYLDRTWSPVNVPQGRAHGAMRAPTVAMEALRELRVGEELF